MTGFDLATSRPRGVSAIRVDSSTNHATPLRVGVDTGEGRVIVLLAGFGMPPAMYRAAAELLSERCRVVVPDIYRVRGLWRRDDVVNRLSATIANIGMDSVTIIGHSFAGGIELSYAARFPEHVRELVFADTLCTTREFRLAHEATRHPVQLLRMATPSAARSFGETALTHPSQIVEAAWFGFTSSRGREIERVAELKIRSHVLWANRDSILRRADGEAMARELQASFAVARSPEGRPIDHDWVYRDPELFVGHVRQLNLDVFPTPSEAMAARTPGTSPRSPVT
jgi:pimeloyl-ACP methyl ester carboxylesterase